MRNREKGVEYSEAEQRAIAFYDTHTAMPDTKSFTEKISDKYTMALVIIGMILGIGFIGLFMIIETYETSAEVINIAGQQRMLSQRISKFAHNLMHEADKEKYRRSIVEAAKHMESSHDTLTDDDSELNSRGALSPEVSAIYFNAPHNLDEQLRRYITAAKALANEPDEYLIPGNPNMNIIEAGAESLLLQSLDFVVRQYQIDSESAVKRLQVFAGVTFSSLLITLFLVGRYIFLPLGRQVQKETDNLALSEKRCHDITSSLGEGVIVSDSNGDLIYMNPAAEQLLGWTDAELQGKSIQKSICRNSLKVNGFKLHETIEMGVSFRIPEDTFIRKDGTHLPVSFVSSPITHIDEVSGAVLAFHDISTLQKAEKERLENSRMMQLIHDIGVAANEAITIKDAMKACLSQICSYTGWPIGHVYLKDSSGKMIPTKIWFMKNPKKFELFQKITEATTFIPGKGLPGRVLQDKSPHWITDVTKDPNFPRAKFAGNLGLKGAFAFPVLEGENVEAVLEFFSEEAVEPDQTLLKTLNLLSTQFGRIMERKEAEKDRLIYVEKMENALSRADDVLNLLSKPPSLVPFFVTSPLYRTTKSIGGGDTIRWLSFRTRYAGIYLHDVSGHDIQEILLNILATAIVDNHKLNPGKKAVSTPSLFFHEMNKELLQFCHDTSHYITAAYSLMDFEKHEITLSLAGHPKPWLINPDGTASQVGESGFLMGQFDLDQAGIESYVDTLIRLKTGQRLLIYTDGLMEEKNCDGIPFEEIFKRDIIPGLKGLDINETYELLKSEFEAHIDGLISSDDVSFILIGTRPAEKYETDEFVPGPQLMANMKDRLMNSYPQDYINKQTSIIKSIDADANSNGRVINDVSEAYTSIIKKLSADGWPQKRIDELSIALREIVTNSFLHGNLCSDRYVISINHVIHGDVLEVSVSDKGIGFDGSTVQQSIKEVDLLKKSGMGLHTAGMYADRIFFNDSGNRCWMLFSKN